MFRLARDVLLLHIDVRITIALRVGLISSRLQQPPCVGSDKVIGQLGTF